MIAPRSDRVAGEGFIPFRREAEAMHIARTSALLFTLLAPLPGVAESQSSNSSSNCSNGRCSRVDSLFIEDGGRSRGYVREEHWREERWREGAGWHAWRERAFRAPGRAEDRQRRRQRDRDDDDD